MESMIEWDGSSDDVLKLGQDSPKSKAEVVAMTLYELVDCLLAATAESASPDVETPAVAWPAN